MLFIYTSFRYPLLVGVISAFILSDIIIERSHSLPLPPLMVTNLQVEKTSEDSRQRIKQHSANINQSDYYQTLFFRIVTLFVGIFLIFLLLMCLCSMCWCASWTVQWPITGFAWSRRFQSFQTKTRAKGYKDPPPSYDVILAYKEDKLATGVNTVDADEEPPSYTVALLNLKAANGAF